jgi:hypothetical protein
VPADLVRPGCAWQENYDLSILNQKVLPSLCFPAVIAVISLHWFMNSLAK